MKTIKILLAAMFCIGSLQAQPATVQTIVNGYLQVKDALVKSDPAKAAAAAAELSAGIGVVNPADIGIKERTAFETNGKILLESAETISKTTDLAKQRTAFAALSVALWKIIEVAESIKGKVYYQYCPMKKAYWLSLEPGIKNPYYGSSMLSCGNISAQKN
ncbi:MAG TPA: DUF3347 domain-containing protein [Sediminibacterium sp.]|nr:DUF3347 domain-containing protein [Sediminibacterium sp.]